MLLDSVDIFIYILCTSNTTKRDLLDVTPKATDVLPRKPDCLHCGATKFSHEAANFCYSKGDIVLANNKLPSIIRYLLTSKSDEAKTFRICIRTYNNHLAFTSLGVKCDKNLAKRNNGIYTFKVQGQMYHFINDLLPFNRGSKNQQFYFHDTDHELSNRIKSCTRLSKPVLSKLLSILETTHTLVSFVAFSNVPNLDLYKIFLHSKPGVDQRMYNKPTIS